MKSKYRLLLIASNCGGKGLVLGIIPLAMLFLEVMIDIRDMLVLRNKLEIPKD